MTSENSESGLDTSLGRWLLIGLVVLLAAALYLLISALLPLWERGPEAAVVPITLTPTPTATPSPTLSPTPSPTATPSPTPIPPPTPLPAQVGFAVHVVSAGETLEEIARGYGSLVPAIATLNRFPEDAPLGDGQVLVIPLFALSGFTKTAEVRGVEVSRGLPGRRVALTFDAGAGADPAPLILDTLKTHGVHVTFFLTGKWAEEHPDLVRRMAAEGHEFGNHTYSHPHLLSLDKEAVREEIRKTERIVRELAGQSTQPYLRPPYGERNQALLDLLAEEGYVSIYWTVDSLDSVGEPKSAEFLLNRVTHPTDSRGNPIDLDGAIILMHVGNATTAEALPAILEWFQKEGYRVVRVSEILRP